MLLLSRFANDQRRARGEVGDAFRDGAERLQSMQPPASKDEQIAVGGRGSECLDGVAAQLSVISVRESRHGVEVDVLAAGSDDGPERAPEAVGNRRVRLCRRGQTRASRRDPPRPAAGIASMTCRATSTEHGALWTTSVMVEPLTMPSRRPRPLLPTTMSVASLFSASRISVLHVTPGATLPEAAACGPIAASALTTASSAPERRSSPYSDTSTPIHVTDE